MESQRTTYIEHDNSDLGEVQISNDVLAVISAMAAMEVDGWKHHSRACFKTWNEEII